MIFNNQNKVIFDVSFWQAILRDEFGKLLPPEQQKHIDFQKMKANGTASAVVIRAGQHTYLDSEFRTNWTNARNAGFLRASYWFCDKDSTPESQARLYWNTMKDDVDEGFLCGDLEAGSWIDIDSWYRFFNELQQISGLPNNKIFLYTGYYFWTEHTRYTTVGARKWFSDRFPLWLAAYTANIFVSEIKVPIDWYTATLWQNGTPPIGLENGVWSKEIDHNYLNGGDDILSKYFGVSPIVTPPPPPVEPPLPPTIPTTIGITKIGKVVIDALNIRSGAGTTYPVVNTLNRGDRVFGYLNSEDWFRFGKIERANGTIEYLDGWCSGNYKYIFITDNYDTPDKVEYPYDGVSFHKIRYGKHTDVHVTTINMTGKTAMVTNTVGALRKTSDVAKELNAQIAVNMDAWNATAPFHPLGYAVSNGLVYSDRRIGVPFLSISKDQKLSISNNNYVGYNAASGFRYIVQNGIKSSYLNGSDVQYVERHPRRAVGIIDENNLVLITTDGRSSQSIGITLAETADILLRFGVKTAFDNDSGGSASQYMESMGGSIGSFSDGVERPVINHLVIFVDDLDNGGNIQMDDLKLTSSDPTKTRSIRATAPVGKPHIFGTSVSQISIGSYAKAKFADRYVYPANVLVNGSIMAKAGDIWHKIYEVNGNASTGWVAEIHLGARQLNVEEVIPVVVDPPVETGFPVSIWLSMSADGERKEYKLVL